MLAPVGSAREVAPDVPDADPAGEEQDTAPRKRALTKSGKALFRGLIGVVSELREAVAPSRRSRGAPDRGGRDAHHRTGLEDLVTRSGDGTDRRG
jgi:hypothetical protein